jgi:hypothetical protein
MSYVTQPASYPMGTGGSLPKGKVAGGVKLTTHLHLVPRSRTVELYLHSSMCLHSIVLHQLSLFYLTDYIVAELYDDME